MSKPFSIAIHGGAGTILREKMTQELQDEFLHQLEKSLRAGHKVLAQGGSAVDAVVSAVTVMEDSPLFNAGKGAVMTSKEMVEMDASIMDGQDHNVGAIAGVQHIKNPIHLARQVMQDSEHVFLIGEGAEAFAFDNGYAFTEQDYFFTERRYEQLLRMKQAQGFALSESEYPDDDKHGTVGAVALDQQGNLAAATSTGGVTNKQYGRVGDSPIIGAGTYAENGNVAVSCTGMGEFFIRKMVAGDVAARMRYLQEDIATACDTIIQGELKRIGGEGGLVAMDAQGQAHFSMNSSGMYRGAIDTVGNLTVKIYSDE
ncbi:isoaspartyl peptidase/L-asparaginase family protein [Vibrio palustris]|uniref:Isoaspartyl peptidase n=1 Tax=Vibrio palustris TaxID=1918946 RepID=A0A1R4B462_9VIBR|nr:isoaspartyl peptidase/L-asparaginase [Vibrio palustris]SJL83696.1 Isoaspartyl peptidase precursor [Vibrio palustris]